MARAPLSDVETIRNDPESYFFELRRRGVAAALEDLLCHSLMEVVRSRSAGSVEVEVLGPYTARIRDNGRGVGLFPEPGQDVSHAVHAFTRFYPVEAPDLETGQLLRGWAWGDRLSLGPVVANAAAASLRLLSQKANRRSRLEFSAGAVLGPAVEVAPGAPGTEIWVAFEASIFRGLPTLDAGALAARMRSIGSRLPQVRLGVRGEQPIP